MGGGDGGHEIMLLSWKAFRLIRVYSAMYAITVLLLVTAALSIFFFSNVSTFFFTIMALMAAFCPRKLCVILKISLWERDKIKFKSFFLHMIKKIILFLGKF